jgi:uncharacterized surface protein with fasciclin (FAS1) repeats
MLHRSPLSRRALMLTATLTASVFLVACATVPAPASITDTAARTPQLSTLARLIQEAGQAETLREAGPMTVFAPSDEAFKAVPAKTMAELAADKELLKSVLTYHVLAGKVMSAEVKNSSVKTVQGANLAVAKAGSFVTVEDALVTQADVQATNGVIHIIDKVLLPPKR